MALSLLVAPQAQLLTTLSRLKAELGISGTTNDTPDNDDVLTAIITRASSAISRYCNRPYGFGQLQVLETCKGTGSQILGLTYVPVLSIASIYRDTDLMTQVDPNQFLTTPNFSEGYFIENQEAGAVYCAEGWGQTVALMSWGWEAYASRYILPGGTLTQRYTVTYTAGYLLPGQAIYALQDVAAGQDPLYDPTYNAALPFTADAPPLPGEVEQACLVTSKLWYLTMDRDPTIASAQVGDVRVAYKAPPVQDGVLSASALGLLRDYRRVA